MFQSSLASNSTLSASTSWRHDALDGRDRLRHNTLTQNVHHHPNTTQGFGILRHTSPPPHLPLSAPTKCVLYTNNTQTACSDAIDEMYLLSLYAIRPRASVSSPQNSFRTMSTTIPDPPSACFCPCHDRLSRRMAASSSFLMCPARSHLVSIGAGRDGWCECVGRKGSVIRTPMDAVEHTQCGMEVRCRWENERERDEHLDWWHSGIPFNANTLLTLQSPFERRGVVVVSCGGECRTKTSRQVLSRFVLAEEPRRRRRRWWWWGNR